MSAAGRPDTNDVEMELILTLTPPNGKLSGKLPGRTLAEKDLQAVGGIAPGGLGCGRE